MMQIKTDGPRHQIILQGRQPEVSMTWAAALNLGSLLIEKAHEAEPASVPGRTYAPALERGR
jgi:hypothetical protein